MTTYGTIEFPSGARYTLPYSLTGGHSDGIIHGTFLTDLLALHPDPIAHEISLECADGAKIRLLITHRNGSGSTFIGAFA